MVAAGSGWLAWKTAQASIQKADERIAQADMRVAEANQQVDSATQQAKAAAEQTQQAKRDQQQAVAAAEEAAAAQQTAETRAREADGKAQTAAVAQQQAEASAQAADSKAQDAAARAQAADTKTAQAEKAQRLAQTGTRLEQAGTFALSRFEFNQIEALLRAIRDFQRINRAKPKSTCLTLLGDFNILGRFKDWKSLKTGRELEAAVAEADIPVKAVSEYPAASPILALQQLQAKAPNSLLAHEAGVSSASFSADGTQVVTAASDGTARVWDLKTGQSTPLEGHTNVVTSASFNATGDQVVTASVDGTARVWDLQGRQLAIYEGSPAALSPDGRRIAAVVDGRVKVYDIETLPELIAWGCQWLHNYLEYGQATDADRAICNLPPRSAEADSAGPFESSLGRAAGLVGVSWPEQG